MTNKINGIDVSECEHHYTNTVNGIIYNGCAIYEQINELGYSQDTLCEQNPDCYFKQLKRLKEENEELKNRCEEWAWDSVKLQAQIDSKDYQLNRYKEICGKFRQALKEIKERVLSSLNKADGYIFLKIINEVLND